MNPPLSTLSFSRAALREIDRRAVDDFGIPVLVLMENAGRAVADAVLRTKTRHALIVCGSGNNGGDGLVAARHLSNHNIGVEILLTASAESWHGDAATQFRIVEQMKLPIRTITDAAIELRDWLTDADPADIIIDAVLGTGLSRPITGPLHTIIESINRAKHRIISIDIPTGIDCDTGQTLGTAIHATETVTFCGTKRGFAHAKEAIGKLTIADIGVPRDLLQELADAP